MVNVNMVHTGTGQIVHPLQMAGLIEPNVFHSLASFTNYIILSASNTSNAETVV